MEPFPFFRAQAQATRFAIFPEHLIFSDLAKFIAQTEPIAQALRWPRDVLDQFAPPFLTGYTIEPSSSEAPVITSPKKPQGINFKDLSSLRGDWVSGV